MPAASPIVSQTLSPGVLEERTAGTTLGGVMSDKREALQAADEAYAELR